MKKIFKLSIILPLVLSILALNAYAFSNCQSLANSHWIAQATLAPVFNPGPLYNL